MKYFCTFSYTIGASTHVEAKTPKQALKKLYKLLEEDGIAALEDIEILHREYDVYEAQGGDDL
jgi:cyclopropane fatty-acyl-phospholipid synthase-like methyltransferase